MPPKKKKIIKRKVTKADVKKIPKVPIAKPNINISPYDLANMVQQKFRADMEADNIKMQRRQAELAAQKKVIASPEFQKALEDNTKSFMSLQQEMQMFKSEQKRQQVDAQREFQNTPQFKEMMTEITKIRAYNQHSEEMRHAEFDRLQANIDRKIQSSQEAYNQRLEKAITQRETEYMNNMNALREQQAKMAADAEAIARTQNDLIKQTILEHETKLSQQMNDLKAQQTKMNANAIARERTRDQLTEKTRLEYETRLSQQMNDLKEQQAQIAADAIARERTRDQLIEKAQIERQIQQTKEMNERFDKLDSETAKHEVRKMEQKGELHAKGLKRTKDAAQKAANEKAKVQVQNENLEELIEVTKQENENIKRQAYLHELRTTGAANAKAVGEAKAKQELERARLEREIDFEKQHQKSLLENEVVTKQNKKIIDDLQGQLRQIKSSDPTSRLTGDPSLIEVDLYMLGDEKKRYEQAQRELAQARVYQHAILDMHKEVDELAKVIHDTGQGITFSQLYERRPDSIIKAMADLAQMRQGRAKLTENLSSIFPAIRTKLTEIEQRSQQLASREESVTTREQTIGAREAEWQNQLLDSQTINARLQQQLTMATGQQQPM